mgnify:FL=1
MSDVDPLIKRELQWMALGTLENRDLAAIVIRKAKRRRIRLLAMILAGTLGLSLGVFGVLQVINNKSGTSIFSAETGATGSTDSSAISPAQIQGVITDYPVTWEESIGDLGAISKPGGVGDTIGGLTATGLKISWTRCPSGVCPTQWLLSIKNNTPDIISVAPALMIYVDHGPLVSSSRPVTVTAGSTALLVFTFPEFKDGLNVAPNATYQWNWFLTVAR